jgi:hypothetical protein
VVKVGLCYVLGVLSNVSCCCYYIDVGYNCGIGYCALLYGVCGVSMKLNKFVAVVAGCWLFGVGFRMVTNYVVNPGTVYPSPTPFMFDWWFDWLPMVFLGLYLISYGWCCIMDYMNRNVAKERDVDGS